MIHARVTDNSRLGILPVCMDVLRSFLVISVAVIMGKSSFLYVTFNGTRKQKVLKVAYCSVWDALSQIIYKLKLFYINQYVPKILVASLKMS